MVKQEVVPIQDEPEQKGDSHHVHGARAAYTVEKAMQEALDVIQVAIKKGTLWLIWRQLNFKRSYQTPD